MSIRETSKAEKAKQLRAAIQRVQDGTYKSPKLKKRNKVKLTVNTVEIEAGVAPGTLRNYYGIRNAIEHITKLNQSKLQNK